MSSILIEDICSIITTQTALTVSSITLPLSIYGQLLNEMRLLGGDGLLPTAPFIYRGIRIDTTSVNKIEIILAGEPK